MLYEGNEHPGPSGVLASVRAILNPYPAALLIGLLLIGWFVYEPGLSGGFLFDDYPNLEKLGTFGGITNPENLYSYLKGGSAGPTGRPISLLSFLINDNAWPSDPAGFKYTNVLIHLLIGLLVVWTSYRLLVQIGRTEADATLIALLAAGIWLLHPYFVSTTLYVVQRMTQLAALFAMAGIVGYLHGRSLLPKRPVAGLVWMTLSLALGTVLATLSKENGALLPVLVLVMEWSLARHWVSIGPPRWWRILFLWLPTATILAYLGRPLLGERSLPIRPFTLDERLLTQPRIVWEYLEHLFIPRIQGRGLYQDGYEFSTGVLQPWTTLAAILGLIALLAVAVWARRRYPLVALALLLFLAGHLMESTTMGLELYFEHRNYLPAVFLFLPLAAGIVALRHRLRHVIWVAVLITPILVTAATTYHRAALWGDTPLLMSVWAHNSPNSPRAQNSIAQTLFDQGDIPASIRHLEDASDRLPASALLSVRLLIHQVAAGTVTGGDFHRAISLAETQAFDAQTMQALRLFVDVLAGNPQMVQDHSDAAHALLNAFLQNPAYQSFALVRRFIPYLQMHLYLAAGEIEIALERALVTMQVYADTDTALSVVADVASAGFDQEALGLMTEARRIFRDQPARTLKRPEAVYKFEIERLTSVLEEDARKTNAQ
jgi:protein O-mannosyl-transferase